MKILQICSQVPYPPVDGGKVGIFNITKYLAKRGHKIAMIALGDPVDASYAPLRSYCDLHVVSMSTKNSVIGVALNLFSSLPYNISKYSSNKLQTIIASVLNKNTFDVVHIDSLHMASYGVWIMREYRLPVILREHNVESTIMERYLFTATNPLLRIYIAMQLRRIKRYEAKMAGEFDSCCPITDVDARRIIQMQPNAKIKVISGGVEGTLFTEYCDTKERIPNSLVFIGVLNWIPNQDAFEWFIKEVFPRILIGAFGTKLFIIGKDVPSKLLQYESEKIIFKGFIPDLKKETLKYEISIAPFRIGGGLRLKIIECLAMSLPVVATEVGCEGIEVKDGDSILIGNTAEEFAEKTLHLLNNPVLRERIARRGYTVSDRLYRWESVAEKFEEVYRRVISEVGQRKTVGIL